MSNDRTDNTEAGYKCSRCGGMFASHDESTVRCPYCAMLCDETACRVVDASNEEY